MITKYLHFDNPHIISINKLLFECIVLINIHTPLLLSIYDNFSNKYNLLSNNINYKCYYYNYQSSVNLLFVEFDQYNTNINVQILIIERVKSIKYHEFIFTQNNNFVKNIKEFGFGIIFVNSKASPSPFVELKGMNPYVIDVLSNPEIIIASQIFHHETQISVSLGSSNLNALLVIFTRS